MTYKNTRTGVIREFYGKISGGDWVECSVAEPLKEAPKTPPKKRAVKKNERLRES
jgi:hypothetical protein